MTILLDERKRLGQFFTGEPLARLLARLARSNHAASIIDPMAGTGDMLVAARHPGAALTAVEIDPDAAAVCTERLALDAIVGDAFDPATWTASSLRAWDLVITNPPYVRYQRTTSRGEGRVTTPSAADVRRGLLQILEPLDAPTPFLEAARGYSGLADLAVPAWLLCAALVAPGGRLAMVLPNTWLSRDYARPVADVVRRCFEVEFVVEDGGAAWFDDALVRTTLLVARRIDTTEDGGYLHVRLDTSPDRARVEWLHGLRAARRSAAIPGCTATWTEAGDTAVPRQVRAAIGPATPELCTLADLGWSVGQGLRTGANRFFYGECVEERDDETVLAVDPALSTEPIVVPTHLLRTVVRKQQDLIAAGGDPARSPGRLLYLQDADLPEPLARHVRRAAALNVGTAEAPRLLPTLSAVATNVRPGRHWYQVPPLAPRHRPALFIPRVNHGHPLAVRNSAGVVVDANFSTLWPHRDGALPVDELLALLHSPWAIACLEASATVLGGGALKVEATHLRRLPLPRAGIDLDGLRDLAATLRARRSSP